MKDSLPNMDEEIANLKKWASDFKYLLIPQRILLLIEERERDKEEIERLHKGRRNKLSDVLSLEVGDDYFHVHLEGGSQITVEAVMIINHMYESSKAKVAEQDKELSHADAIAENWRREAFRKYPTPEAYDAACAALEKRRLREIEQDKEIQRQEDRYQTFAKSAIQCANERDRYYAELSVANLEIQRLQKLENFVQLYKLNGASDIQEWLEEAEIDI